MDSQSSDSCGGESKYSWGNHLSCKHLVLIMSNSEGIKPKQIKKNIDDCESPHQHKMSHQSPYGSSVLLLKTHVFHPHHKLIRYTHTKIRHDLRSRQRSVNMLDLPTCTARFSIVPHVDSSSVAKKKKKKAKKLASHSPPEHNGRTQ